MLIFEHGRFKCTSIIQNVLNEILLKTATQRVSRVLIVLTIVLSNDVALHIYYNFITKFVYLHVKTKIVKYF